MPKLLKPADLRPGDEITLCGRRDRVDHVEVVKRPIMPGRTVHLYTPDDINDPYLMRPDDLVPVHNR